MTASKDMNRGIVLPILALTAGLPLAGQPPDVLVTQLGVFLVTVA